MTEIHKLSLIAFERSKEKYPLLPDYARVTPKYTDKTANGLTKCIIDFLSFEGHWAERTGNEGRVIDNRKTVTNVLGQRKTIGDIKRIPSSGARGTSDIKAVINGRFVAIEVKIGDDRQSDAQKAYQQKIEQANGLYLIAKDFESFVNKYNELFANQK